MNKKNPLIPEETKTTRDGRAVEQGNPLIPKSDDQENPLISEKTLESGKNPIYRRKNGLAVRDGQ